MNALTPAAAIDWFTRPRPTLDAGFFWTVLPACLCGFLGVIVCIVLDGGRRRRREQQGVLAELMRGDLQEPDIKVLADTPEGERH